MKFELKNPSHIVFGEGRMSAISRLPHT